MQDISNEAPTHPQQVFNEILVVFFFKELCTKDLVFWAFLHFVQSRMPRSSDREWISNAFNSMQNQNSIAVFAIPVEASTSVSLK